MNALSCMKETGLYRPSRPARKKQMRGVGLFPSIRPVPTRIAGPFPTRQENPASWPFPANHPFLSIPVKVAPRKLCPGFQPGQGALHTLGFFLPHRLCGPGLPCPHAGRRLPHPSEHHLHGLHPAPLLACGCPGYGPLHSYPDAALPRGALQALLLCDGHLLPHLRGSLLLEDGVLAFARGLSHSLGLCLHCSAPGSGTICASIRKRAFVLWPSQSWTIL